MSDPETQLREEGIPADDITKLLGAIARETRTMFDDYDIDLPDPKPVIASIQTAILNEIIDLGTELDDRGIIEQFEMVASDFETPGAQSGRYNIVFVLGAGNHPDDIAAHIRDLQAAVVARNYSYVSE